MRRIETYAVVRPFLAHELDVCNRLDIPVQSAVLLATAEGDADEAFRNNTIRNIGILERGVGRAAVVDIREKRACISKPFTNCYWGIGKEMLSGGPPFSNTTRIAKDVALPALEEFLSGRDVCIAALGAKVTGKSHLLFGDPNERGASTGAILPLFCDTLWEAFGSDEMNHVSVSAVEVLPDGEALNILAENEPVTTGLDETFTGPIPGWNLLWEMVLNMHYNLNTLRESGAERGSTIFSLRVGKKGNNSDTAPLAMFIEMEPFPSTSTAPVYTALRDLGKQLSSSGSMPREDTDLPWGTQLLLDAFSGRAWSTRTVTCVSPSPTALQASLHVLNLSSLFYQPSSRVVSAATSTPKRDIASVLAFTPEDASVQDTSPQDEPEPRVTQPQPTPIKTPPLNGSFGQMTPASATVATMDETVCNELIGLVKMLKDEVETLRTELAEERKRHSQVTQEREQVVLVHEQREEKLRMEKDALDKQLREKSLQVEMLSNEKRGMERELQRKEESRQSLMYEAEGLHRELGRGFSPERRKKKSKSPILGRVAPRQGRTSVGPVSNGYARQNTNTSMKSGVSNSTHASPQPAVVPVTRANSALAKPRSRTPPTRVSSTAAPPVQARLRRGSVTLGIGAERMVKPTVVHQPGQLSVGLQGPRSKVLTEGGPIPSIAAAKTNSNGTVYVCNSTCNMFPTFFTQRPTVSARGRQ